MADSEKNYLQGMLDGLHLWGNECGRQSSCMECPIGSVRGVDMTCQEFAKAYPKKFLSLLKEMNSKKGDYTYLDEFRVRFPNMELPVEAMIEVGMCRKAIFEGYIMCEESNCEECWMEKFAGDKTMIHDADLGEEEDAFDEDDNAEENSGEYRID